MAKRKEIEEAVLGFNTAEKISALWNKLSDEEKKENLDINNSDSFLRIVLVNSTAKDVMFLLEESKKLELFQTLLLGDEKNRFPFLNFLLTSEELWGKENLRPQEYTYVKIFDSLYKSLLEDQQDLFIELAFNKGGLVDKIAATSNYKALELFNTKVVDRNQVAKIKIIQEKMLSSQFKDVKLDYTSEEIEKNINDLVFTQKDKEGEFAFVSTASPELVTAMCNLQSYAVKLKSETDPDAIDKSKAIILLLDEMSKVQGSDPLERIAMMRILLANKLRPRDPEETILLKNRGLGAYKAASGFATFFGRPDYKFEYDGKTYYANSSTEHRLIQLYNALSKWEASAQPPEEKKSREI